MIISKKIKFCFLSCWPFGKLTTTIHTSIPSICHFHFHHSIHLSFLLPPFHPSVIPPSTIPSICHSSFHHSIHLSFLFQPFHLSVFFFHSTPPIFFYTSSTIFRFYPFFSTSFSFLSLFTLLFILFFCFCFCFHFFLHSFLLVNAFPFETSCYTLLIYLSH